MLVELVETVSAGYERRERFIVTISRSASFSFVEISTKKRRLVRESMNLYLTNDRLVRNKIRENVEYAERMRSRETRTRSVCTEDFHRMVKFVERRAR